MNPSNLETEHLLSSEEEDRPGRQHNFHDRIKVLLECRQTHWFILFLVSADFFCVITTIVITFLWPDIEKEEHYVIEVLSLIAFIINCAFMIEIALHLFVFGLSYYFKGSNWPLHLFDTFIIIATFLLELLLKGKQREAAGLLIVFRLWRLIKMLSALAVGVGEYYDEQTENLKKEVEKLEKELNIVLNEVDKIANEDMWDESKRARVFHKTIVRKSDSIDVIHE
ncbi:9446_t:CDS:1 [Cetraspora pellucida]|uniref:9446_t:CDS:1 n=1 Tax=Cetraspora pellucida TaxID=1433469 RepID=A0ACA9K691_9GLOM|nr:9446_t:CDS:1 [Cetraspora pellucida]